TRVSYESDGWKDINGEPKNCKTTIKGDRCTFDDPTIKPPLVATFKLDESKTPKAVDFVWLEGPFKGTTWQGIYKIEGDTLTYCFPITGNDRPTEFSAHNGSNHRLSVFKRGQPPDQGNAQALDPAEQAKVDEAVKRGVAYLKSTQNADGTWTGNGPGL